MRGEDLLQVECVQKKTKIFPADRNNATDEKLSSVALFLSVGYFLLVVACPRWGLSSPIRQSIRKYEDKLKA